MTVKQVTLRDRMNGIHGMQLLIRAREDRSSDLQ